MSRGPFIVDVVGLRRHPGRRESLRTAGHLSGLAVTGAQVPDDAVVTLDVTLEAVDGGILVRGRARAPWTGECRRCLTPLAGEAESDVNEIFVADPEEGQTWPIRGDHLDLEPLARESIVLELPLAPVCDPTCRGLCPVCGGDRNQRDCGCAPAERDRRWAALDVLRSEPTQ